LSLATARRAGASRAFPKIENRTGLEGLVPGTLNVRIAQPF
jgi:hypothetical protein